MNDAKLATWHVPLGAGYRRIENDDSLQYVSDDGGRVVYLSPLSVRNANGSTGDAQELAPVVEHDAAGSHLKGTKVRDGEVLVVLITCTHKDDEAWARDLFDKIN